MTEWETEISSSGENPVIREEKLEEVMDMHFSDAIWLTLTGKKPTPKESDLFRTVLSSCIDHGVGNPSTVSARTVQSGGNEMNTSVAAGILALGNKHGGAIEDVMKMLQSEKTPEKIVDEKLESGEKVPGIGHKVYSEDDPRAQKILEKLEELELKSEYTTKMIQIREEFARQKTDLVLNVDGAIAAAMSDIGMEPELGKGIFIIARTPGLVAHVREEIEQEDFRRQQGEYTGD